MGLLFAILGLSFLIFFHELGHFLFARLFGVRVLVFSIGFGKKLITKQYKGTEYTLSLIPLGGYVKLKGEITKDSISKDSNEIESSVSSQYDKDSLLSKHTFQRILILLAGPLFNFILAFFIYIIIFAQGVPSYSNTPIIGDIGKEFLAYNILKKDDEIISINGIKVEKFSDISHILNENKTQNMEAKLLISRPISYEKSNKNKEILELLVPLSKEKDRIILGITPAITIMYFSPIEILQNAIMKVYDDIMLIYKGLRDMLLGLIGLENLSSVVGITDVSAKAYNAGFVNFILVLAIISVNLGVINLLPIPIVDGGQILFTLYEWLTGKALHERIANILVALGLSFIITLMLLGLYNDIVRIVGG
ncbi:RIP metalloprotease RseP [Helicobacter bilis]|uniref:RIP metalloprotease RseP n=1 Tax=Helicobacter bilis TaxID=37372 RepID=UPI002943488F|nr:RIP metalloprotease RseP [Helicobacter bilis]